MYDYEQSIKLHDLLRLSIGGDQTAVNVTMEGQRRPRTRTEPEYVPRATISFFDQAYRDAHPSQYRSFDRHPTRQVSIYFPERFYAQKPEDLAVVLVSAFLKWKANADAQNIRNGTYLLDIYADGSIKTQYPKAAIIKEAYSLA